MADIQDILKQVGLDYKESGDNYRVPCWLHDDKTPSMFIHKATGVYHCFSCHTKGNLISLVRYHLNLDYIDALLYLRKMSLGGLTEEARLDNLGKTIRNFSQGSAQANEHELCELPANKKFRFNDYLMNTRKITLDEIRKYDIRECIDTNYNGFNYNGWVLIPIYFNGILRSFFLRDPINNRKIYGKYDRSDILYGYDQITDHTGIICITEGMFDKYFCERIGQQSVAALSNRLLDKQQKWLRTFSEIVIFHDNDKTEAGLYLIRDALDLLVYTKVSVASLPLDIKDCADLDKYNKEQLLQITKEAFDNRIDLAQFLASKRYRNFLIMEHERLYGHTKRHK